MRLHLIDVAPVPTARQSFQTLSLPRLASCTPAGIDVYITDGRVEEIDIDRSADVVGLTFSCNNALQAYELAGRARAMGAKVVAGGTHATAMPEEALQHVDAVLSGEAEGGAWARVLEDLAAGRSEGCYRNQQPPSISGLAAPRLDLLRHPDRYLDFSPMEATRGCPHGCSFCFNSAIHGPGFRTRPVEEVVEDARRSPSRNLMFMDDNLCGKRAYAKELFEALIPLKKRLFFQTHLLMAEDLELLDLARRAGAHFAFVGIESFEEASLASVEKSWNPLDKYKSLVRRFHDHDIFVSAGLILGLDCDGPDIFDKTIHYLNEIEVDNAAVNLLIPYPGTDFYRKMKAEGRLLTDDYRRYTGFDVVVEPKSMTVAELERGYDRVLKEFYRPGRYARTLLSAGMWKRAPVYAMAWWREPRRRTFRSLGRSINRRGGDLE
ncbi:MAG TPA: radical SAM protein [Myxococcota bacterium]|nr:radical SAM protein [Myxococcota bacterium]